MRPHLPRNKIIYLNAYLLIETKKGEYAKKFQLHNARFVVEIDIYV